MPRAYKGKKIKKLKSNRGAAKRFRASGSATAANGVKTKGGFKSKSAFRNHILTKKTTKRKRRLRSGLSVRKEDLGRIQQMLPYA